MRLLINVFALTLTWLLVNCESKRDKLFFLQKSSGDSTETLLVVTWTETEDEISAGCEIFKDKDLINKVIKSSKGANIRTLSGDEMDNLLVDCTETSLKRRRRESISKEDDYEDTTEPPMTSTSKPGYDGWPVIFPGTKWCGAGDVAKEYDDLGVLQDTDRCCRAHDLCNDTLAPGETRHNITNKSTFTKLSCECDEEFYDCLDSVNSVIGNTIGNMYFNILRRECYAKNHPTTDKCKRYRTITKLKCLEYERDTSAKQVYQWIPAKTYKRLPVPGPIDVSLSF